MLDSLIRFSLRHRAIVLVVALATSAFGFWLVPRLPVDVFPNLNRPTVTILTESRGLAPEEVETLVTLPLETALNGTPGVLRIRSSSGLGLSIVFVEFDWGTDIFLNRQLVSERLQLLQGRLPAGILPIMGPVSSIMGEIQVIGLTTTSDQMSSMDLRTFADWTMRPRLMTLPGVSQVVVMGGDVKQYQILVSSQALQRVGLSLEDLKHALSEISDNTTGGFVDISDREYLIRPLGRVTSLDDIRNSLIGVHFGEPVYVKDVAEVKLGAKMKRGEASINGKHAVVLTVQKNPSASTIQLTRLIEKELVEIQKTLPEGVKLETDLFKQSHFIESAISNVEEALRDGIVMVAIILFLFLMNVRTTAITLIAIPLSLVITAITFYLLGLGINTMTLGGLAIAIGELVDDAVVDVENVFRRLRENRLLAQPRGVLRVIFEASSEVRNSIVLSTIIVVLVFIPMFALGGIEGRLFVPLGVAYIISILGSLVVSLTITPVLCSVLLPNSKAVHEEKEGRLVQGIKRLAVRVLDWTLPRPLTVLGGAVALLLLSLALLPWMGHDFLPKFNEGTAMIGVTAAPGISLKASDELGMRVEAAIRSVPEVKSTVRRTGRAEADEHVEGVNTSEVDVDFKPSPRPKQEVLNEIREKIEDVGEVHVNLGQPISHRLDHLLSGVKAQIAIKVFGPDLGELRRLAGEIAEEIASVRGIVDLQSEPLVLIPQLKIAVDRSAGGRYAIASGALAEDLETVLNGETVGQFIENQKIFDVYVRLDETSRATTQDIRNTVVKIMPTGKTIRLSEIANVYQGTGPNLVNKEDLQRRIVVSANVYGRDLGGTIQDIQARIAKVELPEGYYVKLGGQFESQQQASSRIVWLALIAFAAIFFVLYIHFRSSLLSAQVLLNIPLALIGSIVAIFVTDRILSVATLVAFVTLCGIASRNGILLISHYLYLVENEGEEFNAKMVIRGSLERLVPVLMTASTAALALVPLLFSRGEPGKEILYPVAVVIVGGLISSTLLDLIVTPTLFLRFGEKAVRKHLAAKAEKHHGDWT